jgi:hypothetical protein
MYIHDAIQKTNEPGYFEVSLVMSMQLQVIVNNFGRNVKTLFKNQTLPKKARVTNIETWSYYPASGSVVGWPTLSGNGIPVQDSQDINYYTVTLIDYSKTIVIDNYPLSQLLAVSEVPGFTPTFSHFNTHSRIFDIGQIDWLNSYVTQTVDSSYSAFDISSFFPNPPFIIPFNISYII